MIFCSHCGARVETHIPEGDDRPRHVCPSCRTIHYENPKVVTGVIATCHDRLLLCRRAIEPRKGYWTIPAGYLENGETLEQGARREAWEEARATLVDLRPFAALDLPHIQQIYFLFTGELSSEQVAPGPESEAVALLDPTQIPWKDLAFPVVSTALQSWLQQSELRDFRLLRVEQAMADAHFGQNHQPK